MSISPTLAVSQAFSDGVSSFVDWVWGWPLIILLFGTHLFLTVRLGFIQRFIGRAIRLSVTKEEGADGDVSNFGALVTALAATIGTGNIIGVASAVAMGGPGAVLWMWLTGVFGIATKYTEALLSVKYRVKLANGTWAGGPMYVLERALGMKWLGILFAIFTCIAAFGIGCMTQANSVVSQLQQSFPNSNPQTVAWVSGIAMSALTAFVVLGGIKSIARFCEFLVPIMAAGYVLGCVAILIKNWSVLDDSILLILKSAFTGQAALGGFVGAGLKEAMQAGIARGLFSNESGLGSAPIVAAAAQTRNPVRQALVSSTGTFWDTVVVCLATGLVIVSSGHWQEGLDKTQLTRAAFADLNVYGPAILTFGLLTFVFSTILGWNYYGEKAAEYLFGTRAVFPYRILWVIAVLVGSVHKDQLVWDFADIANAFMALPNLIALLALSGIAARETWANRHELTGKLPEEKTP
jgi:AGCS family alanine or glycine:cation symporter